MSHSFAARLTLVPLALLCACGSTAPKDPASEAEAGAAMPADAAILDQAARDQIDPGRPDQTLGSDGAPSTSCEQTGCHTPPANVCEGAVLKTYYDPNGTCSSGVCSYRFTTQLCPDGCQGGRCRDAPCAGSACGDAAPPCSGASCDAGGGDSCAQVHCNTPPANECVGSSVKTYYDPNGDCAGGVCSYRFTMSDCPRGCQNGKCVTVSCTPGSATFTADVTDVDSLATVGPLPALAGGAAYEIRSYMQVKDSYAGVRVPIYAPTNMTIQASVHYHDPLHDPSDTAYQGEWGLTFEASCNTQVTFAHVREVVKKIADVTVTNPDAGSSGELVTHPVDFTAGEIIGYYIRGPGYFAWDFVVTDASVNNAFANMARYETAQSKFLHAICPFDPYPLAKRQRYLDILGTNNDPPKPGRKCGTVVHDKAGTVAGVWFHAPFAGGTAQQARDASGNPLSVFKAETDVVYVADVDGDTNQVGFTTYRIEPTNPTYRDPETVTTAYCYERHVTPADAATGWVYLNLVSATQLQVAYSGQGACPATFPTTGVRTLYR